MARQTGKFGQVLIPLNDGALNTNVELTLEATKEIQGVTYTNRFYGHASKHWNGSKAPSFRPQGFIGSVDVSPVASVNDTVSITACQYYADNGSAQTMAAQRQALVRDATKNQIHAITVNAATGSIGVTTGVASVASFSDTFGADAGPALLSVGKLCAVEIRLTPGAAGVVASGDICVTNLAGELVQERADVPSGEIFYLHGGVLFSSALRACHTGNIPRKVFATFYSQTAVLAALAHTTKWGVSMTSASTTLPAQGDAAANADVSGPPAWTCTFERYAVDQQLSKLMMNTRYGFVRLYRDRNVAEYREGAVIITGLTENVDQGAADTEAITMTGNGPLEWNA